MCRLRPRSSDLATPSTIGMPFALRPSIGLTGAKSEVARRVVEASHQPRGDVAKWFHVDRAPNNRTPGPNLGTTPRLHPGTPGASPGVLELACVRRCGTPSRSSPQGGIAAVAGSPRPGLFWVQCRMCSRASLLADATLALVSTTGLAPCWRSGGAGRITPIRHRYRTPRDSAPRLPLSQLHRRPWRHARIGLAHCRRIDLKTGRAQPATARLPRRWRRRAHR